MHVGVTISFYAVFIVRHLSIVWYLLYVVLKKNLVKKKEKCTLKRIVQINYNNNQIL